VAPRRITYIPWGLDLDAIDAEASPAPRRAAAGPVIGCLGRIEPRKGQLELVRGFAHVRRRAPTARLELIGPPADAEYAARVAAAIHDLGLERSVTMTGHVRRPYRRILRWDLLVSLAADEGQGLAVLEAMALGVPVLARAAAGVEDYLVDGVNGWVCRGVSAAVVAQSVHRTLSDAQRRRIVARARRMVERHYAWDRTVGAIARTYER
jgi:phosphatidylinositol alpha-1,6-mannosyltransferase